MNTEVPVEAQGKEADGVPPKIGNRSCTLHPLGL